MLNKGSSKEPSSFVMHLLWTLTFFLVIFGFVLRLSMWLAPTMALQIAFPGGQHVPALLTGTQCIQGANLHPRQSLESAGERAARLALRDVEESFHFFLQKGLANSAKRCYESGQRQYFTFCDKVNFSPLPASEDSIALFISYLGSEKVSSKTIKSYLAAVRHLHILFGLSFFGLSPRSHLLIRDRKCTQGNTAVRPRLPSTPLVLRNIKTSLTGKPLDL